MSRFVFATIGLLPALCTGLIACASSQPAQAAKPSFDGEWFVQWCDKSAPDADCGGFSVSLWQAGDRLCGDYSGARVRLSQIDEGGRIHGIVVGSTTILTIESERSGGIYLVQASIQGNKLHWKMRDTVRNADHDIDIIANDDVLERRPLEGESLKRHNDLSADCKSQLKGK